MKVIVLFGLLSVAFADSGYQYHAPVHSLAYGAPARANAPAPAPAPSSAYGAPARASAPAPAPAPSSAYGAPARASAPAPAPAPIKILRDDRENPEDGKYSFDFETENGIVRSESGSPEGQEGSFKFTFPTGEEFDLKFVADEDGYQPESSWIPVAPEFPHPIPQFVLDQIEKAAREDAEAAAAEAAAARAAKASAPAAAYGAPPATAYGAPPAAAYGAPPPPAPSRIYSF